MAEGGRLENDLAVKSCHVGSNPTSSAHFFLQAQLLKLKGLLVNLKGRFALVA